MFGTRDGPRLGDRGTMWLALSAVVFFVVLGRCFVADVAAEKQARDQVLRAASHASAVFLNGERLDDPSVVLGALRGLTHVPAHHSSPVHPIRVTLLVGDDSIQVILARDSNNPNEYWTYRAGPNSHNDPLGEDAGRVVDRELTEFLQARRL